MASPFTPQFGKPDKVQDLCEEMQKIEYGRAQDRALIDNQFNGAPPYTAEEAEKLRIEVNVNWGEGGKILDDANRQVNSALIFKSRLAVLSAKRGQPHKRVSWSEAMTEAFNDALTQDEFGRYMMFALRSRNASFSLHGVGALMFTTQNGTKPRFVPLNDLLIPTDTNCDLDNLSYFGVNLNLSQGELFDMVQADPEKWDQKATYTVLNYLQNTNNRNQDPISYTDDPEKWVEWRKQNAYWFYANSDAVPKVQLRVWYYSDPKTKEWYRKVLLRYDAYAGQSIPGVQANKQFLYEDKEPFAKSLNQFLHLQYGDCSRVPPLKHHSVRGIGVMLYSAVECMNRVRCQVVQHVFQDLLTWFRVDDPADRDRLKHFVMDQFAVVPRELSIIPANDRYQANQALIQDVQSQFRQLMNESSASFVRDIESGGKKEMTLGEAQIRLQQVNVQVSGMLKTAYSQEVFLYAEFLRRLLLRGTVDPVAKKFQRRLDIAEVPKELREPSDWRVDIEQVLGAGDQTLAQYQANLLLSQKMWMDPQRQRIVERDWITVTTGDPAKAKMLVPDSADQTTNGAVAAQNIFGSLMIGIQLPPREGIDQQGYVQQMLTLMAQKVVSIKQATDMGTPDDVMGLQAVAQDISNHIQILAQDPMNKDMVKKFGDALGQLTNHVKAFGERQQQAAQKAAQQNGGDPKVQAAAQGMLLKAQVQAQIKQASAAQKAQHNQVKFEMEEARKNIAAMNELNREDLAARQQMALDRMDAALKALTADTGKED